ncbi:hypothetical protein NQ315_006041 [Exocentrus adspersus]|uniref:THAP-type domain-containing protein n=1 Tax=Exocentrus adspersus TaxID=1586481 RepID=A0AAV8VFW6_9CUCU|nr:hypothetical protein NQ315_006041 [Exocentrus adspersus]
MVGCAAFLCKSRSGIKEPDIPFHRFSANPVKKNLVFSKIENCKFGTIAKRIKCSKHFEEYFFYITDF